MIDLRQAGTWDPLPQCCNAGTWTHIFWGNKIQTNYMEAKITACMCSWGKLRTKDTKRPKNLTVISEEPGIKTGCQVQKQGNEHALCTQCQQRGGQNTQATTLDWALDTPLPSPHIWNKLITTPPPPQGSIEPGEPVTCSPSPPAAVGAPIKPCLNFLSGI